uniref:Heat shock protein 9 n=1 Tax=Hypsizygus marmoreus TaxID=39966 RepID=S0BD00_HYPMA|nr:heat shock protein 9 [Hypsizygus marmoreus]
MSDTGRQSFTDKAGSALKPDSQKTTVEQAGDYVKGTADSAASTLTPSSEKSTSQKAGDTVSGSQTEESLLDKAKHAVGMGK